MQKVIKFFNKNYLLIILNIILIILTICIFTNFTYDFDNYILLNFAKIRNNFLTKFMILISEFGRWYFIATIIVLSIFLLKNKKDFFILIFNSFFVLLMNLLIKIIFTRIRPINFMIVEEKGYSFPSGHAMVSFTFYVTLLFLIKKYIANNNIKKILQIFIIILIILIPISRIYLGVHYLTDVVAGILISAIIILIEKKYLKLF